MLSSELTINIFAGAIGEATTAILVSEKQKTEINLNKYFCLTNRV
jgi:hypothetical protein